MLKIANKTGPNIGSHVGLPSLPSNLCYPPIGRSNDGHFMT